MTFPVEPGMPSMVTLYAILDNGSVYATAWEEGQPGSPSLPSPGRVVTEAEYTAEVDRINAANEQRVKDAEQALQQEAKADYDALIAAGIPSATAGRLTRYVTNSDDAH